MPFTVNKSGDILKFVIKKKRATVDISSKFKEQLVDEIEQGNSNAKLGLVLRALNELGVSLIAESSQAKQDAAHTALTEDEIDIDAIADTGLRTTRPKPPAKRSKR